MLAIAALTNLAFEIAGVFYNAMLPEIVSQDYIGRLSGWAWAWATLAGWPACLVLYGFIEAEPPPFGLDPEAAEDIRIRAAGRPGSRSSACRCSCSRPTGRAPACRRRKRYAAASGNCGRPSPTYGNTGRSAAS